MQSKAMFCHAAFNVFKRQRISEYEAGAYIFSFLLQVTHHNIASPEVSSSSCHQRKSGEFEY